MGKLLMGVVVIVVALGAGLVGGHVLRDGEQTATQEALPQDASGTASVPAGADVKREYARLSNQFVIPVMKGDRVSALVALSISLEVPEGKTEAVMAREPKVQDAFLQVLFDHANAGGFIGAFTEGDSVLNLRRALLEKAQAVLGADVVDVLITEMARQDA